MKKILTVCAVAAFTLTGCIEQQPTQNKTEQSRKAADAEIGRAHV